MSRWPETGHVALEEVQVCESMVVLRKADGSEELVMQEAAAIRPAPGGLVVSSVIGEAVEVDAEIHDIDLMGHRIVLIEKSGAPEGG